MLKEVEFSTYISNAKLTVKPHQIEGVNFTLEKEKSTPEIENVKGGFICDEMGLGKTIVMIGTILANLKKHTLIVVPYVLLKQWYNEIFRTTGHKSLIYHGINKNYTPIDVLNVAPIVITTYGEIANSKHRMESFVHDIKWDRVIFDEAHHLRNMKSNTHKGGCKLRSPIKWMISGTPIQNRISDFYALCNVLGFSTSTYTKNIENIITYYVLKRSKADVGINLPEKIEKTFVVPWDNESEKMLAEDIHSMMNNCIGLLGLCDIMIEEYGPRWKLPCMLRARQMCVHPALFKKKIQEYQDEGVFIDEDYIAKKAIHSNSKINFVSSQIISNKDNCNRKIVFCHYRMEMDFIKSILEKNDITVKMLDGRTPKKERNDILTSDCCEVLILQINTCCEGLNLQEFNEIYFVSPHWNPAVEDQAVARCHRIGQKKKVHVYRFKMEGFDEELSSTLDLYCSNIQEKKRELFELIR